MGFFNSLFGGPRSVSQPERVEPGFSAASFENPSTSFADPAVWLTDWANGGAAKFGPPVSERTAMACSAVYRCTTLRSGLIASLPLKIYEKTPDGRKEASQHRLQPMFQVAPYPGRAMTAFTWRELWEVNTCLWGNHYSIIRYDGAGRIIGFQSVLPWDVEVYRHDGQNMYRCLLPRSTTDPADTDGSPIVEWVHQSDMIHIPGPGFNGVKGVSPIRAFARNAVALAQLLEEQTGVVHENASRPSAFVTIKPSIKPEGFERFKRQFTADYAGRQNAGRVIFGDEGTQYTPMQMSPEDLHTIEARRYQVADISRFYGVPLHLLNETEKSTSWGSGLSEQTLAFLIFTLEAQLGRIESELNYKLFANNRFYVEFDRDGLMAMDPLKAAQVAQTEIASATLTPNEYRRRKNRPPVPNGDEPLLNAANISLASLFRPGAQPRQDPIQTDPLPVKPDVGTDGVGSETS